MTRASSLEPTARSRGAAAHGPEPGTIEPQPTLLVDAHVHIHPAFDLERFFSAALRNLGRAAAELGIPAGAWQGALLLAEAGRARAFEKLAEGELTPPAGVRVERTNDPAALRIRAPGAQALHLIAGRQVATTAGVEVLSLGTREVVPDGLELEEAIERSLATGGITAIPWGFGKWTLARGNRVRDQLTRRAAGSIALGDNGGRLRHAPAPRLFRLAAELGFAVLPGSDPFPFESQVERVGSYGFVLSDWRDPGDAPARALVARVRGLRSSPPRFGRLTGLAGFTVSQLRMQLHNRLPSAPADR